MKHTLRELMWAAALFLLCGALAPGEANAARIKDIAYVEGVRDNQLLGYGLVVGLPGTGDQGRAEITVQSTASMLGRMGIRVDEELLTSRNVAAVMVTADLPAFARSGQRVDVTVSSIGNARSLQGGQLLSSPLRGPDGEVYAVAQGSLSVGGVDFRGNQGSVFLQNQVTTGRVPNGALIERDVAIKLDGRSEVRLILRQPDFSTAVAIARRISELYAPVAAAQGPNNNNAPAQPPAQNQPPTKQAEGAPFTGIAQVVDAATIRVEIPAPFADHVPQFIAAVETLEVRPSSRARVVINERTGTVVMGGDVRVREVAVAHGNLRISVSTENVAAPTPLVGVPNQQVVANEQVDVTEEDRAMKVLGEGATIADVVSALNTLGATPRDLIVILQAIKSAGALDAELVIQ